MRHSASPELSWWTNPMSGFPLENLPTDADWMWAAGSWQTPNMFAPFSWCAQFFYVKNQNSLKFFEIFQDIAKSYQKY